MEVHKERIHCLLGIASVKAVVSGGYDKNICLWYPNLKKKNVGTFGCGLGGNYSFLPLLGFQEDERTRCAGELYDPMGRSIDFFINGSFPFQLGYFKGTQPLSESMSMLIVHCRVRLCNEEKWIRM